MQTANVLHSLSIHLPRRARKADKKNGVSPERRSLLSVLTNAGSLSINHLPETEAVSAPAISRVVSPLESPGLVKRLRNRDDARTIPVHATAKGRRLMEAGRRRRLEAIAGELSQLSQCALITGRRRVRYCQLRRVIGRGGCTRKEKNLAHSTTCAGRMGKN